MKIGGLMGSTLLDYPGRLACIVFTQGCQYDCFYCHNRPLIDNNSCGNREVSEPKISLKQFYSFLKKRAGLLEGVVISGGEPTLQSDLAECITVIKKLGYLVKLDTNGSRPKVISALIQQGLLDYIALDVKAPWLRYKEICGKNAQGELVASTLSLLRDSSVPYEIRTTMCPTLHQEDIVCIAHQVGYVPLWRWNLYKQPLVYKEEDRVRVTAQFPTVGQLKSWATSLKSDKLPHIEIGD